MRNRGVKPPNSRPEPYVVWKEQKQFEGAGTARNTPIKTRKAFHLSNQVSLPYLYVWTACIYEANQIPLETEERSMRVGLP